MKNTFKRIKIKLIGIFLPWVGTAITALLYTDKRSLFLDRLVSLLEK